MPVTDLTQISEHVYWMPPDDPDRPSLCAVVSEGRALMLEAGASDAHAQLFLTALSAHNLPSPRCVVLTHWHWDHVFGAAEISAPLIACQDTANELAKLARYDWSDSALDARVKAGEEIAFCADNIKLELPEPRQIRIAQPDIIFQHSLELRVGQVTCQIQQVGGDHAADSCVIHIMPDRVLFLGDCLYDAIYARMRHYTTAKLFPLLDTIQRFEADVFIEGHSRTVLSRADMELLTGKMRVAGNVVNSLGTDESVVMAEIARQTGQTPDEDMTEFARAFIAGKLSPP